MFRWSFSNPTCWPRQSRALRSLFEADWQLRGGTLRLATPLCPRNISEIGVQEVPPKRRRLPARRRAREAAGSASGTAVRKEDRRGDKLHHTRSAACPPHHSLRLTAPSLFQKVDETRLAAGLNLETFLVLVRRC